MIAPYVDWSVTVCILSSAGHVKSCVNLPEPSGKAKYIERPIANKYREGKMQRTLKRESKSA